MKKRKRRFVRTVAYLSALVLVLAVWGSVNAFELSRVKKSVRASDERALTQLGTYLDDINLNLQKCTYCASDGMLSDVTSKLWRSSSSAKENLSEITDGNTEVSEVYKFLSQVGEYTLSLKKRIANGEKISAEESENLDKLLEYSQSLSNGVNYLIAQQEDGLLDFEQVKSTLQSEGDERLYLGDELTDVSQSLNDYPTLIYDGPFSDRIESKTSAVTQKLGVVTESEARESAAQFTGVSSESLHLLSKTQNNLSTYTFYNSDYTVSVTQKGGIVNYMLTSRYAAQIELTSQQAIKKATEFLSEHGYEKIKDSYYSTTDGICTVNFSYYDNGITYYTDLIKVSVALDTGDVTAFDSTGYLMNHQARTLPENIKYTPIEAKKLVKDGLKILSYKKVFIPTQWETEEYAYEYRCTDKNGQEVLIYIDPVSGDEIDVLILLYTDGGVLTK